MRTTLTIDDDVLAAARAMAAQRHLSLGEVVSELARKALERPQSNAERNGIPLLPPQQGATIVSLELVNRLRDELP